MLKRILICLAVMISLTVATAGTRDPDTPDESYIEFGKKFLCVQKIKAKTPEGLVQGGSVVIIGPNWALTAAHVISGTESQVILKCNGEEFDVSRTFIHPGFDPAKVGFHDIAICRTEKDFGLDFYVPLHRGTDEIGKSVTISGHGLSGTFSTGAIISDGLRRAGRNKIDSAEMAVLVSTPSRRGDDDLPLEFCISLGDSGGGMFIGNELAGINSFLAAVGRRPNSVYGDEAAHTRISLYVDWINAQIESYEPPSSSGKSGM